MTRLSRFWNIAILCCLILAAGQRARGYSGWGGDYSSNRYKRTGQVNTDMGSNSSNNQPNNRNSPQRLMLPDEFAPMVKVCALTADQVAKILEKIQARKVALDTWDKTHSKKQADLREELTEAKVKGDADAARSAETALKELQADREKTACEGEKPVLEILNLDQRIKWESYLLIQSLAAEFRALALTQAQWAKVKPMCDEAASGVPGAGDDLRAARNSVKTALIKQVEEDILSQQQREKRARLATIEAGASDKTRRPAR